MELLLTSREILIAIVLASAFLLLELVLLLRRRKRAAYAEPVPAMAAAPDREAARLREEVAALRGRLEAVEEILAAVPEPALTEDMSPYGQAVRLAKEGLPAPELARRCGISRGEAELIVALHQGET